MPNLVGIGNSQVPTNAMLGGLAYQDSVGEINIEKIKARTSDNALNIFVYDTRKDSDGGAWRYRTQNTSWYNEVVSGERGARREFPSVAVIVVTSTVITIYDGDNPNLPMWMVLKEGGSSRMLYSSSGSDFSGAVSALNGNIYYGMTGNGTLGIIEFVRDGAFKHRNNNRSNRGRWRGTIADRNLALGWSTENKALAGEAVSDIATTVLPNAPIETSTGLPVPTIAAATEGGTSIIKDDGTIVDIVYTGSPNTAYVNFRESDNAIVMSMNSNASYVHVIYDIPTSDISGSHQYQKEGIDDEFYRTASSSDWNQEVWIYAASPFGGDTVRIANNVISGNGGINVLSPNKNDIATDTMVARIASSFNSGYMHGDIKAALLSDTDTTNLSGGNKVSNSFDWSGASGSQSSTPPTGWTGGNGATFAIQTGNGADGNYIRLYNENNGGAGPNSYMYQAITTVVGKKYKYSAKQIHRATISVYIRGGTTAGASNLFNDQFTSSSSSTPKQVFGTFTATSTTTYISLGIVSGTHNYSVGWDDVVVTETDDDRSIINNGLHAYGTITKTPVATGAELIAYSGFSASNYLQQPYNSDYTFGTSDFSIMFWVKHDGTDAHQTIVGRDEREFNIFFLSKSSYNRKIRVYAHDSSDNVGTFDSTDYPYPINSWTHICVNFTSGNTCAIYIDGVLDNNGTLNYNINNTTYALHVGVRNAVANGGISFPAANCKLALLRISKSAPSADQVKKIYDDEKCLYHENAKCTLHGTSNEVVALAHDDTDDTIYAGTSSGRSQFQGLNRINNTTTAVTTAISASNEFVAEQ